MLASSILLLLPGVACWSEGGSILAGRYGGCGVVQRKSGRKHFLRGCLNGRCRCEKDWAAPAGRDGRRVRCGVLVACQCFTRGGRGLCWVDELAEG